MNLEKTNRSFTDIETKKVFNLYRDSKTGEFVLQYDNPLNDYDFAKGTTVNGFYIAGHDDIEIKLNNGKKIKLPRGYFYNLKENEDVTHRRYTALKMNFRKT